MLLVDCGSLDRWVEKGGPESYCWRAALIRGCLGPNEAFTTMCVDLKQHGLRWPLPEYQGQDV